MAKIESKKKTSANLSETRTRKDEKIFGRNEFKEIYGEAFEQPLVGYVTSKRYGENFKKGVLEKEREDKRRAPGTKGPVGRGRGVHIVTEKEEGFVASPIYKEKKHNGEDEE